MRTSFNIPDEMLSEFDETWEAEGLDSRSRAVREAMEEYIEAHTRLDELSGEVITLVAFDYEHERIIEELHDVQHEFQDIITTTSHMHSEGWCLEGVFCRGPAKRVRELVYELRDFDGVSRVKPMLLRKT